MSRRENSRSEKQPLFLQSHPRPVTRRQFLGQGFLTGAVTLAAPNLLGLLGGPGQAWAQSAPCSSGGAGGKIPFVCFDLAGGASVSGSNVLVGGPLGQLDPLSDDGYRRLGLPADQLPTLPGQVDTQLGLAFHADSAFLRGILDKTSVTTRANTNGVIFCTRSDNDTGNNPHNPMYGINKAGADGSLVRLIGTRSSDSGGNSMTPQAMFDPEVRSVKIDRPSDATGLVDTGKLVQLLDQDDAAAVMYASERITELKLDKMSEDAAIEQLVRCAFEGSTDLVATFGDPSLLDAFQDPDIAGAGGIFTAAELDEREFERTAAVMKLVINGHAGAGTIEFGGYDYHNGTRATGEVKDFEAGQAMGAVLEYAARRGQPVVVYVFSDGSVASDGGIDDSVNGRGKLVWSNDNSSTAGAFMLVYDPNGPPQLVGLDPLRQQMGFFRTGGTIETAATPISNNVTQLAEAIVLNYMALHDELGRFDAVLPGHGLGNVASRDALVAFQPIASPSP